MTAQDRIDAYADAVVESLVPWLTRVFSAHEDPALRKAALEVVDCIDPLLRHQFAVNAVLELADAEITAMARKAARRITEERREIARWEESYDSLVEDYNEVTNYLGRAVVEQNRLRRLTTDVANGDGFTTQIGGALIMQCDGYGRTALHCQIEELQAEVSRLRGVEK